MRVRPALRVTAIVVFVILVPIVAHQIWDYIELRRLVAEIEAIRQKQEPVSEAEAGLNQRSQQPDAQRAGRLYTAAAVLGGNSAFAVNKTVDGLHEWIAGAIPEPPADASTRLQAVVADSADALRLADQAGALVFKGFAPGTDYNYRTSELNGLSRLVALRTLHLASSGQADAAVESALSTLTLQRAISDRRWTALWGALHETAAILSLSNPSAESLLRL